MLRDYTFQMTAGQTRTLNVAGDFFGVVASSGGILLSFDDATPFMRYQSMGGSVTYTKISVTSPINQTVIIALGTGTMYDSRGSASSGGGSGTSVVAEELADLSPERPQIVWENGAALSQAIVPPSLQRKEVILTITCGSPDNFVIVGCRSDTGTNSGVKVFDGGSISLKTLTGVWGYFPHAVAANPALYAYVDVIDLERAI